jgi:hypothetical protein
MANWTFKEEYGKQYPSLQTSLVGLLVFSEHALNGDNFTGTLDVAASGVALGTLGPLVDLTSFDVAGTVTNSGTTLTIALATTPTLFVPGLAKNVPFIGKQLTAAGLEIHTIADTTDQPDDGPKLDVVALNVTISAGDKALRLKTRVPMNGGLFTIRGTFENFGITLQDLGSLMGRDDWFPGTQLGPYNKGALSLLGLNLTLYVKLKPSFTVSVVSVTAGIGLTGIELMKERLYMNPLGVWVTVAKSTPTFAIEGAIALCNYDRPGDYKDPDFVFAFSLGLPQFSFSGEFDNRDKLPINTLLKDLLGKDTSVGLPSDLTIKKFAFAASADTKSGSLTDFSSEVVMSGGFGVFGPSFDVDEISIAVAYSA